MAKDIQEFPRPMSAPGVVRSELRARRVEGIIHNMNSVLQIISGHAALMKRRYPGEERCDKLVAGIHRVTELTRGLLGQVPHEASLKGCVEQALERYNLLCPGGEKRAFSIHGQDFELEGGVPPFLEAYILLLLESCEGERSYQLEINEQEATISFNDSALPDLPAFLSASMADVGIELLDYPTPALRFHNLAQEGI